MAQITTWYAQDLQQPVKVHHLPGNVFSQDNQGNVVGVEIFDDGVPVALSGTVSASIIRSDRGTVAATGSISENKVSVAIPEAAYAVPGPISIVVKVVTGTIKTTVLAIVAVVYESSTDTPVDPGTVIPSIQDLIAAINDAVAQIPSDYSGMKRTISAVLSDESGDVKNNVVWELGGINTDTGAETTRTDCVRTQLIPINAGDSIQAIRLDTDNKASGWWANAHYYDENQVYIASVRPGSGQYSNSYMRIPSLTYPRAVYVRFSILTTNADIMSHFSNVWACFVRRGISGEYNKKLLSLKNDYRILDISLTNAGGISSGTPYDIASNSARFRTNAAYPFPKGSFIVIPDGYLSIYKIWVTLYWDAGRYDRSIFGDDAKRVDSFTPTSFDSQEHDGYIAFAGQTLDNLTIENDMLVELGQMVKIAVPKQKHSEGYSERLGGDVSGAENLFDKVPFLFYRAAYPFETCGNRIKQAAEDTRIWQSSNADFSVSLPAGVYHILFHFLDNTGSGSSAVAYKVFDENGVALIDYGGRETFLYDVQKEFTLSTAQTIRVQWKSYAGNEFEIYLYAESYKTLKQVSQEVNALSAYTWDAKYTSIYAEPVQALVKKYDATIDAGTCGYIWISDLHINSLYPARNEALKRQLMACADIANRTNIQFVMIGGDIMDREITYDTLFSLFNQVFVGVKGSRRPVLLIVGNHDDNPYTNDVPLSKGQTKALFVDMNGMDVQSPGFDKSYYYVDRMGIRFICMDGIDYPSGHSGSDWWSFSQAQVTWLAELLLNTNQRIVLFSHITPDSSHECYNMGDEGGYVTDASNLVDAYNNHSSITLYGRTYDYSSNTGTILYWHAGHQHFDEQYIPVASSTLVQPEATSSGWRLNETDGLCSSESGYAIKKYPVTAGERIKIISDDRFQFQNSASVPSSGSSNRVGGTYQNGTFDLIVPNNATYLIISTKTTDSSAAMYRLISRTFPLLITTCAKDQTSTDSLILVSGNTYVTNPTFPWNSFGWTCQFWPNRTLETINEAGFDVVCIGSNQVNVFRVGAGVDRSFPI